MKHVLEAYRERDHAWDQVETLCPICLKTIPGLLRETSRGVVMEKHCPDHGSFEAVVCNDRLTYEQLRLAPRKVTNPKSHSGVVDQGCPDDCGLCPAHDQHTCLAILEITSRCDLHCPVCLAGARTEGRDLDVQEVEFALKSLINAEGKPTPLQLSGGEATLHPTLIPIIRKAKSLGFTKIELDTNGLALAEQSHLAGDLRTAGLTGVYLQMDGLSDEVTKFIRGRNMVDQKFQAIENCKTAGLQVVLSVTVIPGVNDDSLWDMIQFALKEKLTGVNFQALTLSGRYPPMLASHPGHFTAGHFMRSIEIQSAGKLLGSDLEPIPCPDPRCGLIGYALVRDGELIPLKRFVQGEQLFDVAADLSDWDTVIRALTTEGSCGCSCDGINGSCGDLDDLLPGADFFSIGYHGMMDAYNFDIQRVKRCCVHELTSDGRLIPFCLYNIKYRSQGC